MNVISGKYKQVCGYAQIQLTANRAAMLMNAAWFIYLALLEDIANRVLRTENFQEQHKI